MPLDETFLQALSQLLYDSIETADAIGRSLIVQKDASLSKAAGIVPGKFLVGSASMSLARSTWFVCDDKVVHISWDLIPDDVLQYIRYKSLAIAGMEDAELLDAVRKKLEKAVAEGMDFGDFKGELNQFFDAYGVTRISNNHLQTVFRTNVFSSFAIAQLEQVNAMQDRFPVWRYVAIKDDRTRPSHLELDGNIYDVGEGPIPPIDYNCRCTAQYLHTSQAPEGGFKPLEWKDQPKLVKLDIKESFDDWVASKKDLLSAGLQNWIEGQQ